MYSLTDAAKAAFKKYHKDAEITFYGTKETREISSSHIWGLEHTGASVSGNTIAIGEFNASTLTLTLNNGDGDFSDLKFSGGELYVQIKTTDGDGVTYYMPLGYFLVDSAPRKTKKITVECYDRAVLFDYAADFSGLTFPATLVQIADYCATQCAGATGMKIATDITTLPNGDFEVESAPDDDLTYRQVLMAIAEITGTVARMNTEGNVEFKFYAATGESLTAAERYSHDLYEDDTVITGVSITDEDGTAHLAGADTYAFAIEDNALLTGENVDLDTIAANIYAAVQAASVDSGANFYYRAFEAETVSLPYIEPLDIITYTEPDGTEHPAIVTNTTFVMNGKGKLEGRSDSSLEQGLSSVGALTAKQKAIIAAVEKAANEQISELDEITTARVQALSALNETISNALGLYVSTIDNEDGSTTTIFHNASTLAESTYLFIMTGDGFAYANEWSGSIAETTWTGGIDKSGNAIVNTLTVYQITADQIAANAITTAKIAANAVTADQIAAGTITANEIKSGTITGDQIAAETITASNIKIGTEDGLAEVATSGSYSDLTNTPTIPSLQGYICEDGTVGSTPAEGATGFVVSSEGLLQASNAVIYGTLYSSVGKIGGFTLSSSTLTTNSKAKYNDTTTGVYIGTDGIGLGAGTFYVTSAGKLYASNAEISGTLTSTSGTIGGFTLSSSTMYAVINSRQRLVLDADDAQITFYDGSSSYQSYANFDYNGLGSLWRTSNTEGEEEQTGITQFPYVALDCYARGGLDIYYWYTSGNLYSHLQVWLDSSTGYLPTIEATGGCGLWIKSDGALDMVGDVEIYESSPIIYLSATTKGTLSGSWYLSSGTAITSDRNLKNSIEELTDEYTALFDGITPVRFKYNDGTSDRYHTGFIAQEVKEAIENAELTTQDAAMYVEYEDRDGATACAVRYSEIIALCVNEIQKLKSRVATLERG